MLKIARNAGATLERAGSETEAYLRLPPATLDSRVSEMVDEQLAQTDYRLKQQAKQLLGLPGRRAGDRARACATPATAPAAEPRRPRRRQAAASDSAILSVPPLPHVLHPAVSDPHPARAPPEKEDKRTFLQKVAEFIHPGPGFHAPN